MDEPADNDEEYDSDFGEDEFEDEQGTLNFAEIDLNIQGVSYWNTLKKIKLKHRYVYGTLNLFEGGSEILRLEHL